jgi:hypothetical protein
VVLRSGELDPLHLELLTSKAFRNQYLTLQHRLASRNSERQTNNAGRTREKYELRESEIEKPEMKE